jgi:2',3'-cyclic-nucleotide 2'-phosphodiesterase (5'-nucleotidase family)
VFTPLHSKSGALVVEAGNDGYLGRMRITLPPGQAPAFAWTLMPIGRDIPDDPAMKRLVDAARAPFLVAHPNIKLPMPYADMTLTRPITAVVGHSDGPLDRRQALDSTFNRVFAETLRRCGGTELAMSPGFRFDAVIAGHDDQVEDNTLTNGDITLEDVYRFFPVVYTLSTAEVSGRRLQQIVEHSLTSVYSHDAFAQGGGWVEGFAGLGLTVNLAGADGARIERAWLTDNQAPLDPVHLYTITGCSRPDDENGMLCSHPGFHTIRPLINPTTGKSWTVNDFFLDLLAKGPLPAAPAARMTDHNATPVWPRAPFVQPVPGLERAGTN